MQTPPPRSLLVDDEPGGYYHVTSRPLGRPWLHGYGRRSRKEDARRHRLIERIKALTRCCAVEVYAYAVMSEHFHLVLRYEPRARESWTDEEVARRWAAAFPPGENGRNGGRPEAPGPASLLEDAARLERARRTLGSLSGFLQHLEHPSTRRAHPSDRRDRQCLERRLYSEKLATEDAVLAAMAHVDLHPVRAGEAKRLVDCRHSSIGERLRGVKEETPAVRPALPPGDR